VSCLVVYGGIAESYLVSATSVNVIEIGTKWETMAVGWGGGGGWGWVSDHLNHVAVSHIHCISEDGLIHTIFQLINSNRASDSVPLSM